MKAAGPPQVRQVTLRGANALETAIACVALLGVLGAVWYGSSWVQKDERCVSCHIDSIMSQGSVHETTRCAECHRGAGPAGAAVFAVEYASMAVTHVIPGLSDPGPEYAQRPPVSGCVRCHELGSASGDAEGSGADVNHAHLRELGVGCDRCHAVGHDRYAGRPTAPAMSVCLECHDGSTAPSECDLCHVDRPSDVVSGVRIVAKVAPVRNADCRGCHSSELERECIACHGGYEMPHPAGWTQRDHLYPAFVNQPSCEVCHEMDPGASPSPHGGGTKSGGFCNECHSFPTPHGERGAWIKRHGPASSGESVPQPACEPCHSGDWVANCLMCHPVTTCESCHAARDAARRR